MLINMINHCSIQGLKGYIYTGHRQGLENNFLDPWKHGLYQLYVHVFPPGRFLFVQWPSVSVFWRLFMSLLLICFDSVLISTKREEYYFRNSTRFLLSVATLLFFTHRVGETDPFSFNKKIYWVPAYNNFSQLMNNSNTQNPDLSLCHYFLSLLKPHVFVIYDKGTFKKIEIFINYSATFSNINSYDILFFIRDNIS